MKPPVESVKVSAKGKEILIRVKRRTGLQQWNELCRMALCRSLGNPTLPSKTDKLGENSIVMEWKTFAGKFQDEFAALIIVRAKKDGIDISKKEALEDYIRSHLERGIASLQVIKDISMVGKIENA